MGWGGSGDKLEGIWLVESQAWKVFYMEIMKKHTLMRWLLINDSGLVWYKSENIVIDWVRENPSCHLPSVVFLYLWRCVFVLYMRVAVCLHSHFCTRTHISTQPFNPLPPYKSEEIRVLRSPSLEHLLHDPLTHSIAYPFPGKVAICCWN